MAELKNLIEKTKCPYCGEEFETEEKQCIHRSTCDEAGFEPGESIPNNPETDSSDKNKVQNYRRNNNYQKWKNTSTPDRGGQ